ncbi:MAG: beta-ketoacyl synthase N-terminal-like domain-containing protein [Gammaproteobacteria bacterium]|nr:beta-ketoacyl synthase N-terminal-like domain-containing protein [Gammaproteobacteria bacterium]
MHKKEQRMERIAIVGISCQFPGADNSQAFWNLIRDNRVAVRDGAHGGRFGRAGGYIDSVEEFDANFFGISAREAQLMDPQQRLLLQNAWHAIEDAGIAPHTLRGSRTGVFVGAMSNDWAHIYLPDTDNLNSQTVTGNGLALLANRLSYQFDFKGPSLTLDSACSSSLVALHYAIHSLRAGECDYALVAGVNAIVTPTLQVFYQRAGLAAADGRCKPFSRDGDGIVRAEGVGVVLMCRADVASQPYAVVRACAVNHGGRANGLTAPSRFAQESVLAQSYALAGLAPAQIGYIECHGTGTQLGDHIELRALQSVHGAEARGNPCHIGSIKGLIGHTEAAAGMAGLIKVALMLRHGHVPASLHADAPHPVLTDESPVQLVARAYDLPVGEPIFMSLSAFGLGGTNAHVVLERTMPTATCERYPASNAELFLLSGHTPAALAAEAANLAAQLRAAGRVNLPALAARSHALRRFQPHREALVAGDCDALCAGLEALASESAPHDVSVEPNAPVVFLFTGDGSQYPGMGRALYARHAAFRQAADACDALFQPLLGQALLPVMFDANLAGLLGHARFAQAALFTFEYAMAQLWFSHGVKPQAVIGHGTGEFAAACLASVFTLAEAVSLVAKRAQLIDGIPVGGQMLAVNSDVQPFVPLLESRHQTLAVAAVNGHQNLVLSGSADAIAAACAQAEGFALRHRRLDVTHAFHSPLMAPVLADFQQHCRGIAFRRPRLRYASTLTGTMFDGVLDAEYWTRQTVEPIKFLAALQQLGMDVRQAVGIEVGPSAVLTALALRSGLPQKTLWLPSVQTGPEDTSSHLESLAALFRAGRRLQLDGLYGPVGEARLPPYAFARERIVHEGVRDTMRQHIATVSVPRPDMAAQEPVNGTRLTYRYLSAVLACSVEAIAAEARLSEDLGLDSITLVELIENLNSHLPPERALRFEDAIGISTVGDLCKHMDALAII